MKIKDYLEKDLLDFPEGYKPKRIENAKRILKLIEDISVEPQRCSCSKNKNLYVINADRIEVFHLSGIIIPQNIVNELDAPVSVHSTSPSGATVTIIKRSFTIIFQLALNKDR